MDRSGDVVPVTMATLPWSLFPWTMAILVRW